MIWPFMKFVSVFPLKTIHLIGIVFLVSNMLLTSYNTLLCECVSIFFCDYSIMTDLMIHWRQRFINSYISDHDLRVYATNGLKKLNKCISKLMLTSSGLVLAVFFLA